MTTRFTIDCRGVSANVEVFGEGPVVAMIGTAVAMDWTRPLCRSIARRGYTVVNFDYQQDADSKRVPEPRTALDQVDDAADVLTASGFDHAHVVGVSLGAITAYGLAARVPDLVQTLTLVCPVAGFQDTIRSQSAPPDDCTHSDPMMPFLRWGFSDEYLESHLDHAKALAQMPDGAAVRPGRIAETPFGPDDRTEVPTLIIESGQDRMIGSEHPARYLQEMPFAHHKVLEGASHAWFHEHPAVVADVIAEFTRSAI
jgi:pimeloyl-ACP methyl ester carboxylesterase